MSQQNTDWHKREHNEFGRRLTRLEAGFIALISGTLAAIVGYVLDRVIS